MARLNSVKALFSLKQTPPRRHQVASPVAHAVTHQPKPNPVEDYIDGFAYRKLASTAQAKTVICDFFRDLVGQEDCADEVMAYLQQWNNGRSLRSIRDEIARCPNAQRWG